jgi:flagellar basal-body rod protein FlgG
MDRGLYIAASGMLSEMVRQDLISNDLANVSTAGYKSDRAVQHSFGEMLLKNTATGQTVGPLGEGAQIVAQRTQMQQAPLKQTDDPLDFAIEGPGFFAVRTPQGVRYTRDGSFQTSANGLLTDQMGRQVLNQTGQTIRVQADGTVPAGQVGVFAVANPVKAGDAYFTGRATGRAAGTAQAGSLEGSNVDSARTMIDMMSSLRAFESGQKAINTIDSTLEKAVTQVGSVNGT